MNRRSRILIGLLASMLASGALAQTAATPSQPLDLKSAIDFALENNFAIRQARERVRQQEGGLTAARAGRVPSVSASGSYQRNSSGLGQGIPPTDRNWTMSVTATQNLYTGGAVQAATSAAQQSRDAATLDLEAVTRQSVLDVRVAFYNVLLAREKVTVQEQNVTLLQSQLDNVTDRVNAGTASSFEQMRAQVSLANAQVPLITARNDYRLALENLRQQLGDTVSATDSSQTGPELVGTLDYTPADFDLASALAAARTNRPDLQRLVKLAQAAEAGVSAARSGNRPTVSLFGGWQLRKGLTNSFGDSADGGFIGLQSQWNFWDGRATSGRVAEARSVLEQARLRVTETELDIEVEVRTAFSAYQEANELAEASRQVVAQAEEALRLAQARYDVGTATQLDVLQSQVDLTTARTNQLQAYYSYNVAVARLRKAMGMTDELLNQ